MGGFWEAKIIDFRIFFDDFSKHFSKCFLEGKKIAKKTEKRGCPANFGAARRYVRISWEGFLGGDEICQVVRIFLKGLCGRDRRISVTRLARSTTYGGRRMCCARTAALHGETKSQSKYQHGFPAANNALCKSSACPHRSSDRMQKDLLKSAFEVSQYPTLTSSQPVKIDMM